MSSPASPAASGPSAQIDRHTLLSRFEAVERGRGLGSLRVDDVPLWDLIRYPYHRALLRAAGTSDDADPPKRQRPSSPGDWARLAASLARALGTRAPERATRGGVVAIGHPRRRYENGRWLDLYVDPLLPLLPPGCVDVLEDPIDLGHRRPAHTPRLRYLDVYRLRARLGERRVPPLNAAQRAQLAALQQAFVEALGPFADGVDLPALAESDLRSFRARLPRYEAILRRLSPKVLLLVRSARQEAWVAAARSRGVPVVELQHGSPTRGKLNYDYASGVGKELFPDVFASFGRFWTDTLTLPIERERIVTLGFPYFERRRAAQRDVPRADQLLVVSQPDVAEPLARYVLALRSAAGGPARIVLRPHPEERRDPSAPARHARLAAAGVEIADGDDVDLYRLFAASRWQLGVYSTAVYEGIALGCASFVLRTNGHELMARVVERGLARYVDGPDDFDTAFSIDDAAARDLFEGADQAGAAHMIERAIELGPRRTRTSV